MEFRSIARSALVALFGFFCLALATPAFAGLDATKHFFEDKSGALTMGELLAQADSLPWQPLARDRALFGPTKARVWFRFRLPEQSPEYEDNASFVLEVGYPFLNRLELFTAVKGELRQRSLTGLEIPVSQRGPGVLQSVTYAFRLPTPPEPGTEYFLAAESHFPMVVPLRLMGAAEYNLHHWTRMLFLGLFFGALLMAAAVNGALALALRSRFYGNYAVFLAFLFLAFLSHEGVTSRLLWPELTWWKLREIYVYGGFSSIFYVRFLRDFLESARVAPWLDRILQGLQAATFATILWLMVSLDQPVALLSQFMVVPVNILTLAVAVQALRKGVWASKYFLASSLVFNLAVMLFQLQDAGVFWLASFLDKAPHVGTILEVALLSLALADRVRKSNRELAEQKMAVMHAEKLGALGRMAGEIAHEINNPLAIIHGNAVLIGASNAQAHVKDCAATIEKTANRMFKIVKGMRSMARDSRDDSYLPTPLGQMLQDVHALCRERAERHGVRLEVAPVPDDLLVSCRSSEICQVLVNLLSNAFDAVTATPEPVVKVEARKKDGLVEIGVVDNGCGIAAEIRGRIHEPFFTTKQAGQGSGLGLSISRTIVEAHGGALFLDESAKQTRFVFTIPG